MFEQNNHRQDRLTLKLTSLIFIVFFIIPLVYTAVTGKCFLKTCALKLEGFKCFVTQKTGKTLNCPFLDSKKPSGPKVCTVTGNMSAVTVKAEASASRNPSASSDKKDLSQAQSQTAAIDTTLKKEFAVSQKQSVCLSSEYKSGIGNSAGKGFLRGISKICR